MRNPKNLLIIFALRIYPKAARLTRSRESYRRKSITVGEGEERAKEKRVGEEGGRGDTCTKELHFYHSFTLRF